MDWSDRGKCNYICSNWKTEVNSLCPAQLSRSVAGAWKDQYIVQYWISKANFFLFSDIIIKTVLVVCSIQNINCYWTKSILLLFSGRRSQRFGLCQLLHGFFSLCSLKGNCGHDKLQRQVI